MAREAGVLSWNPSVQCDGGILPFDLQELEIRISSVDLNGTTSLCLPRCVNLCEPVLRRTYRLGHRDDPTYQWVVVHDENEAMSHMWKATRNATSFQLGEMQVVGLGGSCTRRKSEYRLAILLKPQFSHYTIDFLIQVLQVLLSCSSCFVPYSENILDNRMTITLTILLTIMASTRNRPAIIESFSCPTLHDHFQQYLLFCILVIALENAIVLGGCWNAFVEFGEKEVYGWCSVFVLDDWCLSGREGWSGKGLFLVAVRALVTSQR